MSQKSNAKHQSNCQIAAESAAISTDCSTANVPTQNRKEDAKQILYIARI